MIQMLTAYLVIVVQPDPLQCHDLPGLLVLRLEHRAVRTFSWKLHLHISESVPQYQFNSLFSPSPIFSSFSYRCIVLPGVSGFIKFVFTAFLFLS